MSYDAVVMGASAGGLRALTRILTVLPAGFPAPLLVVQHVSPSADSRAVDLLGGRARIVVKVAEDKEQLTPATAYLAPPGYHLLVEASGRLALSVDEPVCHCRPSIDVLFESAADVWGPRLIGVVLTGANHDGADGVRRIKALGGYAIVQDPATAEAPTMPAAAAATADVDPVIPVEEIPPLLCRLVGTPAPTPSPRVP